MTKTMGALERQQLRSQSGRIECIACGGSGARSRGGACKPCKGTGSLVEGQGVPVEGDRVVLPQHMSASVEHFTPSLIVEAARAVLGEIDLDPASCALANQTVGASVWYGPGSPHGEDGLAEPWGGRVFLNPPGGLVAEEHRGMGTRSNAALWWARLAMAWDEGEVEAAIFVGFTLEILRSAQGLDVPQPLSMPLCVPKSRVDFDTPNRVIETGKRKGELIDPTQPPGVRVAQGSPGHANVVVWLPPKMRSKSESRAFLVAFEAIGACRG